MKSPSSRERLEVAVRHHLAGRLRDAVDIYEDLLRATPNDADLMQRLGAALAQSGRVAQGATLMSASLELQPDRPQVLLNLARALLSMGRAADALRCCDRAIALESAASGGFQLRGTALAALGRTDEALANLGQAVRLAPTDAGALIDLGVALASSGRAHDALTCFERAIELDANQPSAHHNLAILTARMDDHERALHSFDRALALQPQHAALHSNRGTSLKALGRLIEALESYSIALAIEPGNAEMLHNRAVVNSLLRRYPEALRDYDELLARHGDRAPDLIGRGVALLALDRNADALAPLEKAAGMLPDDNDANVQLGVAFLRLDRHAEAVARFDRALAIKRDQPEVLNNRGVSLAALGRTDEALEAFIASAALAGDADAHTNMGVLFKSIGRYRQAALSFDRALSLERDDPAASFEQAFLHLTLGEFRKGWPLYEARFRVPALAIPTRDFGVPRWTSAEPLAGKTLLVHAEQGLGDTIQFARYLPMLIERGAAVVFEVMPQLKVLMRSLPAAIQIVGRGEPLPPVDRHCPLLSLPGALDTQLATIPNTVPYLAAEPARIAIWATYLQRLPGFRVGIAWQGNMQVERLIWARGRSIPLAALAPLAELPGVSLVSLQKGPGAEQLREVAFRDRVVDLGEELDRGQDAFLDTAAVMAGLDLVISSDTAIAHLAGALARPTWVALNASPDWRWLLDRTDSPWYPTMRLFRQSRGSRGWDTLVADLVTALAGLI
jgi:tetratricopeptide (TPR) repeat protein